MLKNTRFLNAIGFLVCAGLIGYALYAEHVLGLAPCPLCIFQRVAVIAVGVVFLIAAIHNPRGPGRALYGSLIVLAAIVGIGIAARHIWIQAQPPGTVAACGADLNYMLEILPLKEVISKVLTGSGECGTVNWRMLGLSMPWWVAFALTALGLWGLCVNIVARPSKRSREWA